MILSTSGCFRWAVAGVRFTSGGQCLRSKNGFENEAAVPDGCTPQRDWRRRGDNDRPNISDILIDTFTVR